MRLAYIILRPLPSWSSPSTASTQLLLAPVCSLNVLFKSGKKEERREKDARERSAVIAPVVPLAPGQSKENRL
jgi:hypothetical protein